MNESTFFVKLPCQPGTTVWVLDKSMNDPVPMYVNHFEVHRHTGVWAKLIDCPVAPQHTSMVNIKAFNKQVFINKSDAEAALSNRR